MTARRVRLAGWLGLRERPGRGALLAASLLLFAVSFAVKSLHAVDVSPALYARNQPGHRMSGRYDDQALSILNGDGILFPRAWPDPSDTGLLARPPGYPLFLSGIYLLLGRSFHTIQLAQNAVNSLSPIVLFLAASLMVGARAGFVSGLVAALSNDLSHHSSLVTPDALCALNVLLAVWLLLRSRRGYVRPALAGAVLGIGAWLRPNLLLLAPFLALVLVLVARARRRAAGRALALVGGAALAIAPITIRNALVYHAFVPVSINMGIVLWEGIADAGGEEFGARRRDVLVAAEEAARYGDPRYASWWASPDGIERDRDRVRRSLDVIVHNPGWFATAMLRRMGQMLDYPGSLAPAVEREPPDPGDAAEGQTSDPEARADPRLRPRLMDREALAPGLAIAALRPAVSVLQRALRTSLLAAVGTGIAALLLLSWRRALLLLAVPLYYVLVQSPMHLEFRVTLPMHCFLFVFAATAIVLVGGAAGEGTRRLAEGAKARMRAVS